MIHKRTIGMNIRPIEPVNPSEVGYEDYGHNKTFYIDKTVLRTVLITGAGSYIGESFKNYCESHYPNIECTVIDMVDDRWRENSFTDSKSKPFDTVLHVAGIAHSDDSFLTPGLQEKYYRVNTDLAIETAEKAKAAGCSQFIFMSSMIIYGGAEKIDEWTLPDPVNFYGNSKWLADKGVRVLRDESINIAVLRLPMIYGRNSKGNYPRLSKLAKAVPVFPAVENKRSMLYIENLCEFIALITLSGEGGIYFPQNSVYSNTSELVAAIGKAAHRPVHISRILTPVVKIMERVSVNKVKGLANKVFGSSYYEQRMSVYKGLDYQKVTLEESIRLTEG